MVSNTFKNEEAERLTGDRISFSFGENWKKFSENIDDATIAAAEASFVAFTKRDSLAGETFIDIGCGSGLSSLVAARLGASHVLSIDVDTVSIECTTGLRAKYPQYSSSWTVEKVSVLDKERMSTLGKFSYVYSWGVLHHTGAMWPALANAEALVAPGGSFHIALYNKTRFSKEWTIVKRMCNKWGFLLPVARDALFAMVIAKKLVSLNNPIKSLADYKQQRGMSVLRDIEDWLGGYPYEPTTPGEILNWLSDLGYTLRRLEVTSGIGCNEFLAQKL